MMFADRADAGRKLARELEKYRASGAVVFGIPRGGVIVAAEVAGALDLPLDVAVAAKIGAPSNPEYAIGAMAADGEVFVNPNAGYSADEVQRYAQDAKTKVTVQTSRLRAHHAIGDLHGRTAILVDDGLATGLTAKAAATWLKREGAAKVVVAVPVAPADTAEEMRAYADEVVVVDTPAWFSAVGQFYDRFGQTQDDEVEAVLTANRAASGSTSTR